MQGQGLAPGVGTDGDAVVDGGAEELLETVGGFEVEGGGVARAPEAGRRRCTAGRVTVSSDIYTDDGWSSSCRRPI